MGDGALIRPQQWTPEQYDAIKRAVDSGSISDPKRAKYAVNALAAYEVANNVPLPSGTLPTTTSRGPKASDVVGATPAGPVPGAEPATGGALAEYRAQAEKAAHASGGAATAGSPDNESIFTTSGKPRPATTFVRQAGDAATFGLGAKMAGLGARIAASMDATRGGEGVGESGDAVRDEYRATDAASAKENPRAAFLGQITGGMLPALAAGGIGAAARAGAAGNAVANAARPMAQRVGSAAMSGVKAGAAYGGASGVGHSDVRSGESVGENAARIGGDAAIGGGMGAAAGGLISSLGELLLGPLRALGASSWRSAQDLGKNPKTAPQFRDAATAGVEPMPVGTGFQKGLRPGPEVQAELDAANASGGAGLASERSANRAALTARDVLNDVQATGKEHTAAAESAFFDSPESQRRVSTQPLVDELERMIRGQQLRGPARTAIHPEVEPGAGDVVIPKSPRPVDPARAAREAAAAEQQSPFPSSETTPKPRGYKVVDHEGNVVSEHADVASATDAQRQLAADLERKSPRPQRDAFPSDQEYILAVEEFLGEGPSRPGTPIEKDMARANAALTNRVDVRPLSSAKNQAARPMLPPGPAGESLATVRPARLGTRPEPKRVVQGEYEAPPEAPPAESINWVQSDEPAGRPTEMAFSHSRELRKIRDALKSGEMDAGEFKKQLRLIQSRADKSGSPELKKDLEHIARLMTGSKDGAVPGMRQQVWPTLHEIQTSAATDIDKQKAVRQALGVGEGELGNEPVGNAVSALSNAVLSTKELTRGALGQLMEHDPALAPLVKTARGTKAYEKLISGGADPGDALEAIVLNQIMGGGFLNKMWTGAKEVVNEPVRGLKNLAPPRRMPKAAANVAGGQQKEE